MKKLFGFLIGVAVAIGGSVAIASTIDAPEAEPATTRIEIVLEAEHPYVAPPITELLEVLPPETVSP